MYVKGGSTTAAGLRQSVCPAAAPRSQCPLLLVPGHTSPQGCSPTPAAGTDPFSHTRTDMCTHTYTHTHTEGSARLPLIARENRRGISKPCFNISSGNIKPLGRSCGEGRRAQKWSVHEVSSKRQNRKSEFLMCLGVHDGRARSRASTLVIQWNVDMDVLCYRWYSCTCCSRLSWCQMNRMWQMQFYKHLQAGSRANSSRGETKSVQIPLCK